MDYWRSTGRRARDARVGRKSDEAKQNVNNAKTKERRLATTANRDCRRTERTERVHGRTSWNGEVAKRRIYGVRTRSARSGLIVRKCFRFHVYMASAFTFAAQRSNRAS